MTKVATTPIYGEFSEPEIKMNLYMSLSEPFEVTNGVKQGCVMAPTLFSMMFSAMSGQ